jgi:hypothetical protein
MQGVSALRRSTMFRSVATVRMRRLLGEARQQGKVLMPIFDNGNGKGVVIVRWKNGSFQTLTLIGDCALLFEAPESDGLVCLQVTQDYTGGRTVSWPPNVDLLQGFAPPVCPLEFRWYIFRFKWSRYVQDGSLHVGSPST